MRRLSPGRILAAIGSGLRRLSPRRIVRAIGRGLRRLSPRRALGAIGSGLGSARYAIEDVGFVVTRFLARVPRAVGRGMRGFWGGLGIEARRRLVAALGTVVGLILFLGLALPQLPCQVPGAGPCPPPDDAEDLVPAAALAYVHATLDSEAEQYAEATEVTARLPRITGQLLGEATALLPGPAARASFERDIAPWLGGQAALAEVPAGRGGTDRVVLLEVEDAEGAEDFVAELAPGRPRTSAHRGVEIAVQGGLATAQVEGFLALGSQRAVRSVIEVATGAEDARPIADDEAAREARGELPDHRVAEAYLSPEGAQRFVARADRTLASLAPFASTQSTRGFAAALSAGERELELALRSSLDPDRGRAEPGFFAAFAPFAPRLPDRLPGDALAYLGFGEPESTVEQLLAQATAQEPGIARGFRGLARDLRRGGEINIERQLLPALGDEVALVIEPRAEPGQEGGPAPFLGFLARGVDEQRARNALARLQRPVADAIEPAVGLQAPVFRDLDVDGVEARALRISPTIELTYAVTDGLAVIATDPLGVERVVDRDDSLDDSELFERATKGFPVTVSLLGFLDLGRLILVAEQLGLGADPVYGVFASEIRALQALGLAVRLDDDLLATDARLVVEPPGEPEEAPLPIEPEVPPEPELPPDTPGFEPPPERPGAGLPAPPGRGD